MQHINRIYRILALMLAFLMFFTSAGFAVDIHYCQGKLKTVNFIGKAKNCHQSMKQCPRHVKTMEHNDQGISMGENGCCENETFRIQSDQDQKDPSHNYETSKQFKQFATVFITVFFFSEQVKTEMLVFINYRPPLLLRDIPVLVQSFLL